MNNTKSQSSVSTADVVYVETSNTKPPELIEKIDSVEAQGLEYQKILHVIRELALASEAVGGYIKLSEEYSYCPVLMGNDRQPVFLYKFVEILDEILDYDQVKRELPTLSFAQINSAISFLRKVSQFNARRVDIDDFEQRDFRDNRAVVDKLKGPMKGESFRVLDLGELDSR